MPETQAFYVNQYKQSRKELRAKLRKLEHAQREVARAQQLVGMAQDDLTYAIETCDCGKGDLCPLRLQYDFI